MSRHKTVVLSNSCPSVVMSKVVHSHIKTTDKYNVRSSSKNAWIFSIIIMNISILYGTEIEIWDTAKSVWDDLPSSTVASGFIQA